MQQKFNFIKRYPILVGTLLVISLVVLLWLFQQGDIAKWLSIVAVLIVIVITTVQMIKDMMHGNFGLDILALIAMIATLSVGEYLASLIIALMLSGGEALEDYAARRASKELKLLLDRSPQVAHLIKNGGTKNETIIDVAVEDVAVGDELILRPSEVVPVDAVLLSHTAYFNESSMTGESLPSMKSSGDEVVSGSVGGLDALRLQAIRTSANSQYQQIVSLVEEAQRSKAPVVRLADRFAVPFTLVSLLIAGIAWFVSGDPVRFAEVLVLATPCPLLIAAPVAFMGGLSRAAKAGVVIKSGSAIETLAKVKSVGFDKTGTLTRGKPVLVEIVTADFINEDDFLTMVASAEQYSSHVLADGIKTAAIGRGLHLLAASEASEEATNGVRATVAGKKIVVGKKSFIEQLTAGAIESPKLVPGHLVAYVSIDRKFAGYLVLADEIRPEAKRLIVWLQARLDRVIMVTGDTEEPAKAVAAEVGINEVYSDLLPTDKVKLMKELTPAPSLMVGDGVNDAPVLASADVGVAMGARGSTIASEAANIVILQDTVGKVADAIAISKQTLSVALQAIWIGIVLSIMLMLIATTGVIPAVAGAFIQEIIDLVVIIYALRTLTGKMPQLDKVQRENG